MDNNRAFTIKKTFGLGVLMKLTKKSVTGVEINTVGDRFISNVSTHQLKDAVEQTLRSHNIRIKI